MVMRVWKVTMVSGEWRDTTLVEAPSVFQAIEKAALVFEEADGNWPWNATAITIIATLAGE